ncbi:PIN domain-containing protein [Sphaerisporangium sp. NPDC051017]|uniref:PIN domain-containing protein n=1 Tax=Sphaerisporangium sp. NPDC051017 TaxID=3154636 RepID=UPI003438ADC9
MVPVVVYDACALYGNTVRDLLIRVGRARLVQPRWTYQILDELDRALAKRPAATDAKRQRLRTLMLQAVADCLVTDFEPLIDGLKLPDPDDRHVLAAAIKTGAEIIVTSNLQDFPAEVLSSWGIVAKSPDEFLLDLIDIADRVVFSCVQQIVDQRINPPETLDEVLRQLERGGLVESAAALRFG